MSYNVESVNTQFINQSFLEKIEQGGEMEKQAGVAMSAFVRQKLREDGFARKILNPVMITPAELDRGLTEEPQVIVEKEPDSIAVNMPFRGRPDLRYFTGARYAVTFSKIESQEFKKSKFELATYRTDIRTVLQENSVKDLQKKEDENFYNNVITVATANSNVYNIAGGFTVQTLMNGIKNLVANQVPVGCLLMTHEMYADLLKQPSTQIGSGLASSLVTGERALDNFFGFKIVTTLKNDILPNNQAIAFAPPQYFGQMYILQDAMVFLKTEKDMITFTTYEALGAGIGNVNGAVVLNF
jgi:hypothetical protein